MDGGVGCEVLRRGKQIRHPQDVEVSRRHVAVGRGKELRCMRSASAVRKEDA
jgi:hypothetical protein